MEPTKSSPTIPDIGVTVQNHRSQDIASLLAAYALSGKTTVTKVLQMMALEHQLHPDADIDDAFNEATTFICLCYGIKTGSTMSEKK